jgi:hypothetical protein
MGDFSITLSSKKRSSRQKLNKETSEISCTVDQIDLTDVCRIFQLAAVEFIFFTTAQGTFSNIDHVLGHRASS